MGEVSDANPYDRLWQLAKPEVRSALGQLVMAGVASSQSIVVIAELATDLADNLINHFTHSVIHPGEEDVPTVAILHGEDAHRLLARWPSAKKKHAARVPAGGITVIVAPGGGAAPAMGVTRLVSRAERG